MRAGAPLAGAFGASAGTRSAKHATASAGKTHAKRWTMGMGYGTAQARSANARRETITAEERLPHPASPGDPSGRGPALRAEESRVWLPRWGSWRAKRDGGGFWLPRRVKRDAGVRTRNSPQRRPAAAAPAGTADGAGPWRPPVAASIHAASASRDSPATRRAMSARVRDAADAYSPHQGQDDSSRDGRPQAGHRTGSRRDCGASSMRRNLPEGRRRRKGGRPDP